MSPTKTNHNVVSHCKGIQVKMKIIRSVLAKNITTHTYILYMYIAFLFLLSHDHLAIIANCIFLH